MTYDRCSYSRAVFVVECVHAKALESAAWRKAWKRLHSSASVRANASLQKALRVMIRHAWGVERGRETLAPLPMGELTSAASSAQQAPWNCTTRMWSARRSDRRGREQETGAGDTGWGGMRRSARWPITPKTWAGVRRASLRRRCHRTRRQRHRMRPAVQGQASVGHPRHRTRRRRANGRRARRR